MTPSSLAELQALYGEAAFEAERWKNRANALWNRLLSFADGESTTQIAETAYSDPSVTIALMSVPDAKEFRFGGKYHGLYAELGRKLGVSPEMVSGVARGKFRSPRILAAILGRVREIDLHPVLPISELPALSPEILHEFKKPGRYYGLQTEVAKTCGVSCTLVGNVAYGRVKSAHVLKALYAAIAKRNEELKA